MRLFKFIFLAVLLHLWYPGLQAQDDTAVRQIHDRLTRYFSHHMQARACLITDREVYKPGENILFGAMAESFWAGEPVNAPGLKISLRGAEGEALATEEFPSFEGFLSGSLQVPPHLQGGKYVLEAHLSDNRGEDGTFLKLIFVDPMDQGEIVSTSTVFPELLIAGESHAMEFLLRNLAGNRLSGLKCGYELRDGKNLLSSGKLKTDSQGILKLNPEIPAGEYEQPLQLQISGPRGLIVARPVHVNTEKVRISFYAEGGRFVAGLPVKIGFRATTADGQPLEVTGDVTGQGGRPVAQARTLVPGYGIFPLMVQEGEKIRFKIISKTGEGQIFELPDFRAGDLSLSVPRIDPEFIHLNLALAGGREGDVELLLSRGDRLFWASGVKINGIARLKIPREGIPGGLCLLSAFDRQGNSLAERLLYTEPAGMIRLEVLTEPKENGNPRQLLIRADPAIKTDSARLTVSVSAAVKNAEADGDVRSCLLLNSLLENRVPGVAELGKEQILNENILNYLLICNRFKNFSWQSVLDFEAGSATKEESRRPGAGMKGKQAVSTDEEPEQSLSRYAKQYLQRMSFEQKPEIPEGFYKENQSLYTKVKKVPASVQQKDESYLKYLRSGSSIMEVIKMIKPFQLVDGDKIVFPGGNNSLMAQDGAMIVLDGQKLGTSASSLSTISPYDVESISISTSPVDISRYTGLNSVGLIEIRTLRGDSGQKAVKGGGQAPANENHGTTLYWAPSLYLNNEGEVRVQIPESPVKGDIQVEVVAVDKKGRIGQGKIIIKAE